MKILRIVSLWLLALLITGSIFIYQKKTGPTNPVTGEIALGSHTIHYDLKRTHGGESDHEVIIELPDPSAETWAKEIGGIVLWKRYKLDEPTRAIRMQQKNRSDSKGIDLSAYLPHQPPAGKLEYQVRLTLGDEHVILPPDEPAVIRFKGAVPDWALFPHVFIMSLALFVGMQALLSALIGWKIKKQAWITLGLIVVGGLIFGPIVQKYAFGAFWTGWPLGEDLTDNKTAVMAIGWLIAILKLRGEKGERRGRWWVVAATVLMFVVYLIPHSMRGSELDYSALPADSLESRNQE
ncbi:hypothetical protein HQ587_02455 [bacterium]|nr:hypothetical protein [bacterium]